MTTDIPHPDRLGPGDRVGPWEILEVLGAGGLGRVFKVRRDGKVYALKMATRLPGQKVAGEEDVDGWCQREATLLLERTPHPHLPRVFSVDRWPAPEEGFLYVVMEYIDGWSFHDWRYETHPTAAQLVDVLLALVRTLDSLHKRGIHHRDLNANNVLIRREDGRPFLLDFGSVSLPGARTLTQGMPPVELSVVPPEALEHARLHGDENVRFHGGPTVDLYALGVLMYCALTDGYPFNPKLPPRQLLSVIMLRVPRAPHWINPKVPLSLSLLTMRLLSKRPEDRPESAEVLHQALWEAAKARTSRAWKVPLDLPEGGPLPVTDEEMHERTLEEQRARLAAQAREPQAGGVSSAEAVEEVLPAEAAFALLRGPSAQPPQRERPWRRARWGRVLAVTCALVACALALAWKWNPAGLDKSPPVASRSFVQPGPWGAGQEVAPPWKPPEAETAAVLTPAAIASPAMSSKESASVKTHTTQSPKRSSPGSRAARQALGVATACSILAGCPGAQVRPPPPGEPCPAGAAEAMEKLKIEVGDRRDASFFFEPKNAQPTPVTEGSVRIALMDEMGGLPGLSTLFGQLIFGERIYGRFTRARSEDGRIDVPVCIELVDVGDHARGTWREASESSGTVKVFSSVRVKAVDYFE
ncbi:serine/threonine-protein kinase [Stigmatella sp. ncwal1]|uniref:non-specific serine/threonine protein kinase n=1 Tax=Stigmatella ashevillensis TaxID=2995309 RepID=A0ABT5DJ72_9BACT|nr:serine/threonine-protein kinase [Stigmatella ashevillena]MDC0713210.1 serine/threonine-protein kinase [Stigmatella ashevillena]